MPTRAALPAASPSRAPAVAGRCPRVVARRAAAALRGGALLAALAAGGPAAAVDAYTAVVDHSIADVAAHSLRFHAVRLPAPPAPFWELLADARYTRTSRCAWPGVDLSPDFLQMVFEPAVARVPRGPFARRSRRAADARGPTVAVFALPGIEHLAERAQREGLDHIHLACTTEVTEVASGAAAARHTASVQIRLDGPVPSRAEREAALRR